MRAKIEQISQGIYEHIPTEDVVGCLRRDQSILAWAIDGASALTENPFMTYESLSDAGWFARRLSRFLEENFKDTPFSKEKLCEGLGGIRQEYSDAAGESHPLWVWPVAAAIIVEIEQTAAQTKMSAYQYADCFKMILQEPPLGTKHIANPEPQPSPTYDLWKPFSGFEGKKLEWLRERRCQQQKNEFNTALTLNPNSAMNAVEEQQIIRTPAHVVLGSDGLSRIWDTYKLMPGEQAMHLVAQRGLPALLRTLRDFEASHTTASADIKRRDDACGIHLFLESF